MPLAKDGQYKMVSAALTKQQVHRLQALHTLRHTPNNRVTFADIVRDVVEKGLAVETHAQLSNIVASNEERAA